MQVQLAKAQPTQPGGAELDSDCLCPPVCFQCPPPFCLPCGPGPGGAAPDLSEECVPAPKQCGPFILLNTPMERKCIMLPMTQQERPAERQGRHEHGGRGRRDAVECCDQPHHHHHDDECCDEPHHHHHHHRGGDNEHEKCERHDKHDAHRDWHHHDHRERDRDGARDSSRSRKKDHFRQKNMHESEHRGRDRKRSHAKTPRTQSRELRSGKLYIGCDCDRRNGLQDDCQRSLCQGRPECVTIPPTCAPSAFSNGKHLQKLRDEAERKIRESYKLCE